jgi:hypothetical protein
MMVRRSHPSQTAGKGGTSEVVTFGFPAASASADLLMRKESLLTPASPGGLHTSCRVGRESLAPHCGLHQPREHPVSTAGHSTLTGRSRSGSQTQPWTSRNRYPERCARPTWEGTGGHKLPRHR